MQGFIVTQYWWLHQLGLPTMSCIHLAYSEIIITE